MKKMSIEIVRQKRSVADAGKGIVLLKASHEATQHLQQIAYHTLSSHQSYSCLLQAWGRPKK